MSPASPTFRVAALEPYAAVSHRLFLDGLAAGSRHRIEVHALPARAWKWRMRTAALHFAGELARARGDGPPPDLLLASDYLNLAELRALLPAPLRDVPAVLYFHENQLTYPLQPGEARDHHYALTHLYAMLDARASRFNSAWHRESFLAALADLLAHVPDVDTAPALAAARERSGVLPLGTDVPAGEPRRPVDGEPPAILWNHRWEYDKDPDAFVDALVELRDGGLAFRVRALGQTFREKPPAFARLAAELPDRLDALGHVADRDAYLEALRGAHVVVSTARHEFFGLGTLEAIRGGLFPVLPRDLAYPELLPEERRGGGPFLYERAGGLAQPLARALELVASDALLDERRALVRSTDRFAWQRLAPEYDALFERCASE